MTHFMVNSRPLRGVQLRVGLWSMVHTLSKLPWRGVDFAMAYLLRLIRVRQKPCVGASIVVPRGDVGSSGVMQEGGVGYALRSEQSRTSVRVRASFADFRTFAAFVTR